MGFMHTMEEKKRGRKCREGKESFYFSPASNRLFILHWRNIKANVCYRSCWAALCTETEKPGLVMRKEDIFKKEVYGLFFFFFAGDMNTQTFKPLEVAILIGLSNFIFIR